MALALQHQAVLSWFSCEKLVPGRLPAVGKNWCTARDVQWQGRRSCQNELGMHQITGHDPLEEFGRVGSAL